MSDAPAARVVPPLTTSGPLPVMDPASAVTVSEAAGILPSTIALASVRTTSVAPAALTAPPKSLAALLRSIV